MWFGKINLARDREALAWLDESLAPCHEMDDPEGIGWTLQQTAQVARHQGQPERAASLLVEAIVSVRDTPGWAGEWLDVRFVLLEDLAGLLASGDPVRAAR